MTTTLGQADQMAQRALMQLRQALLVYFRAKDWPRAAAVLVAANEIPGNVGRLMYPDDGPEVGDFLTAFSQSIGQAPPGVGEAVGQFLAGHCDVEDLLERLNPPAGH